jgi:hypothetical protein
VAAREVGGLAVAGVEQRPQPGEGTDHVVAVQRPRQVAETTSSRKSTSASDGSGTSGTGPSTGSSVRPTYTVPSGCGSAITKRLVLPGTGAVTQTRRPGSDSPRSTRWLPRLGRSRTSARLAGPHPGGVHDHPGRDVGLGAGQLVAQPHARTVRGEYPGPGADVGAVRRGRARDGHDQAGVVLELPVPAEQAAAQAVDLEAGREGQRLGGGHVARAGERLAGGPSAEAEASPARRPRG